MSAPFVQISELPTRYLAPDNLLETGGFRNLYALLSGGEYVGDPSFTWTLQSGVGRVRAISANRAGYVPGNVRADTLVTVRCTVEVTLRDRTRDTSFGEASFTVQQVSRPPLVTIPTPDQLVYRNQSVQLDSTFTDVGGVLATHAWTATGGTFNRVNVQNPIWTAPVPRTTTTYIITYTGTDDDGDSASASVMFTVPDGFPVAGTLQLQSIGESEVDIATPIRIGGILELPSIANSEVSIRYKDDVVRMDGELSLNSIGESDVVIIFLRVRIAGQLWLDSIGNSTDINSIPPRRLRGVLSLDTIGSASLIVGNPVRMIGTLILETIELTQGVTVTDADPTTRVDPTKKPSTRPTTPPVDVTEFDAQYHQLNRPNFADVLRQISGQ